MKVHVICGDALVNTFKRTRLEGDIIIHRECLIDGPVVADTMEIFWDERAAFLSEKVKHTQEQYVKTVKNEFDKLLSLSPADEIFLWFEHDLFCQINLWFTIFLLNKQKFRNVYRVSPLLLSGRKWDGFGMHTATDLENCFSKRVSFAKGDFKLGENLWEAYRQEDIVALAIYSKSLSPCFPCLDEVCKAEIERKRNARPQRALEEILSKGYTSFNDIFIQFSKKEGIYGFGDTQVDHMLKDLSEGSFQRMNN